MMAGWAGGALTAVALSDGRVQLWAEDSAGQIWSAWQVAFDWTYWLNPWTPVKPKFVAKQAAAARHSDKRLQFWAVDTAGAIWSCWKSTTDSNSAWTAWTPKWTTQAPPFKAVQVAAAPLADGRLQFWAVDTGGTMWSCWKSGANSNSAWTAWTSSWPAQRPTFQAKQVAAAQLSDGRLQLWTADTAGGIWSCSKSTKDPKSAWSNWATQAGPFQASQIAAGRLSDGRLQLWAADINGGIWSCWKSTKDPNSAWTAWTTGWIADASSFQARALCCAPLADGRLQLWAIDTKGEVRTALKSTTDPSSAWTNWALMFSMMRQEQTNWCWAGCGAGVSHFYSPKSAWTQCSLANTELQMSTCCQNSDPCNQYGFLDTTLTTVGHFDHISSVQETDATVTAQANLGQPLGIRIEWRGGGAHFMLVVGGGPNNMISIKDSWYGQSYITYETLQSSYQGAGDWTHSYFTKP